MRDRGEDRTSADAPEAESLGADFWKSARVAMPADGLGWAPEKDWKLRRCV
jgi:hypothetical protein